MRLEENVRAAGRTTRSQKDGWTDECVFGIGNEKEQRRESEKGEWGMCQDALEFEFFVGVFKLSWQLGTPKFFFLF